MTAKEALYAFPRAKYPKFQGFDGLYSKITGDKTPKVLNHGVLSLEDYVKQYELFCGIKPIIMQKPAGTLGNTEITTGFPDKQLIIVLDNTKDFLLEFLSHGIGHVKYALDAYKRYDNMEFQFFTEYSAREVVANLAVQKVFNRGNQYEYIETPFFIETQKYMPLDGEEKITKRLVQKFGVNNAFSKALLSETASDIEELLK